MTKDFGWSLKKKKRAYERNFGKRASERKQAHRKEETEPKKIDWLDNCLQTGTGEHQEVSNKHTENEKVKNCNERENITWWVKTERL